MERNMRQALYDAFELESFNHTNGDRYYILPKSKVAVPSVTTVIYEGVDFPSSPRMTQARNRGTAIHDICEKYLKGERWRSGVMPTDIDTFLKIKKELDAHLGQVNLIESCLWSTHLWTAGRVDLIGEWDGRHAIIDFKTSFKHKKKEYVQNYFLQMATYAMLAKHTYPEKDMPQLGVIIVANDEDLDAQLFIEDIQDPKWTNKVIEVFADKRLC